MGAGGRSSARGPSLASAAIVLVFGCHCVHCKSLQVSLHSSTSIFRLIPLRRTSRPRSSRVLFSFNVHAIEMQLISTYRPLRLYRPLQNQIRKMNTLNSAGLIEEQTLSRFSIKNYYPVRAGEVLHSRYRTIVKLGFGAYSTVWLAKDQA